MLEITCKPTNMEYGNKQRNSQTHTTAATLLDESKRKSKEKCNNGKDERRTLGTNTSIYLGILVLMPQTHHITSPRSLIWGQLIT